jgi:hypothetical protein
MNITTDNIDEWCFRYLEKDLNAEECIFFEAELKNNSSLAKQISLWNKTVISPESFTPVKYPIPPTNLFRYRNQFLLVLFEFVLISSLAFFLLNKPAKETIVPKLNSGDARAVSSSPASRDKEAASVERDRFKKSLYKNLLLEDKPDSVSVFPHETAIKELDTVVANSNEMLTASKKLNQTDSLKISTDTTVVHKNSTQKKPATRHKYRGSRLIPINNDL